MTAARTQRNRQIRRLRRRGESLRAIASAEGIDHKRVVQILRDTGGDPLLEMLLASATLRQLERRHGALIERIARELWRLQRIEEEIESRRIDELNGLA